MYELVRTQLYLIWYVDWISLYNQLHVSASILAIIRFLHMLNLIKRLYNFTLVL